MDGDRTQGEQRTEAFRGIGDLAREFGISTRTIRFYEDNGLISPPRVGTNRIYGPREVARLKWILRGRRLGFSLADIGQLLDLYHADRDHLEQLHQTLKKGRERARELEQQLSAITAALQEMRDLEKEIVALIHQRETAGRIGAPI
jgi:DNA-binding transcriptional MerR regulator